MIMKELSIEEKAKAYDEAFDRARKLKENPTSVFYEYSPSEGDTVADYIFPELKDSEDKKIRKRIIALVNAYGQGMYKDEMIAWLEKKGDYHKGFRDGYNSGIHEEKPLKWTKHDELVRKEAISCLKHWKNCIPTTWNEDYKNILMWLENELSVHTEKQSDKPQGKSALEAINEEKVDNANKVEPRQEKLTEFEKAVKQVMEEAIECGDTRNLKADAEMLLSLVHNSSWSEEDEKLLDKVIKRLHKYSAEDEEYLDKYYWLIELKHRVQPQNTWKPSDKQMKALNSISVTGSISYPWQGQELINLYQDLKKLKG